MNPAEVPRFEQELRKEQRGNSTLVMIDYGDHLSNGEISACLHHLHHSACNEKSTFLAKWIQLMPEEGLR
jgi:hypothetical protein